MSAKNLREPIKSLRLNLISLFRLIELHTNLGLVRKNNVCVQTKENRCLFSAHNWIADLEALPHWERSHVACNIDVLTRTFNGVNLIDD